MKQVILILAGIFYLLTWPVVSRAQGRGETLHFVRDVIRAETDGTGRPAVLAAVDSLYAEYYLYKFLSENSRLYASPEHPADSLDLSRQEKQVIIDGYRHAYLERWKAAELPGYQLIEPGGEWPYLKADSNNVLVVITRPVFMRKGKVGFCLCSEIFSSGMDKRTAVCFYRKKRGRWKPWIYVVDPND